MSGVQAKRRSHQQQVGNGRAAAPRLSGIASWPVRCRRVYESVPHARQAPVLPARSDRRRSPIRVAGAAAAASAPTAAATSPQQQQQHQQLDDEAAVSNLLGWAQANGVDISRVGVFVEPDTGERGFVAAAPVAAKGDPLLVVPIRLALVDAGAAAGAAGLYAGAPWSVRLASRLLRERGLGDRSPWSAYVRALPRRVPAASAWGWDAARSLRNARCERGVHASAWLADDAFERLAPRAGEVWGEAWAQLEPQALREAWDWALACVHSRTFFITAPQEEQTGKGGGASNNGGSTKGARAMVPLIDLVNHAGDEAVCGPSAALSFGRAAAEGAQARDNVRWDLVRAPRPSSAAGGGGGGEEWALALTALRPLVQGEELLLSYGERPNDDFLIHYGFVPALNPHDDVELFAGGGGGGASGSGGSGEDVSSATAEEAAAASRAAAEAALEEAAEWHWAQRQARGGSPQEDEEAAAQRYRAAIERALEAEASGGRAPGDKGGLRVAAGSRVSPGLVALFAELERGGEAQGKKQQRAAERLVARRCWELLARGEQQQRGEGLPLLRDLATLALDEAAEQERAEEEEGRDRPFGAWLLPYYYRTLVLERGLCGPDGAWVGEEEEEVRNLAARDAAAAGDDGGDALALARRTLGGTGGGGGGEGARGSGDSYEEHLATTLRAYKAMILADCVVDSGASLEELV